MMTVDNSKGGKRFRLQIPCEFKLRN